MKKPISVISNYAIFLGLGITTSHAMEGSKDIVNKEILQGYGTMKAEGDSLREIASYLPIHDLCSMELVCKNYATVLRNAPQYAALIYDHKDEHGWKALSKDQPTAKDKFIYLKADNYKFLFHVADLWRNFFPFIGDKYQGFNLKRTHYWDKLLNDSQKKRIEDDYRCIAFPACSKFINISPTYYFRSLLGICQLERATNGYNPISEDLEKHLHEINNTQDMTYLETTKAGARLELSHIHYVSVIHVCARLGFNVVLNNSAVCPQDKANAQLQLAIMDFYGEGIPKPDFTAARNGFNAVLNNNASHPTDRALAQYLLAEMGRQGQGIPVPDFVDARIGFEIVLKNNAVTRPIKEHSQYALSEMDRLGQGISKPDFAAARKGFNSLVKLKDFGADLKLRADIQFGLAEMDLLGQGIAEPNFVGARIGFHAVFKNKFAAIELKRKAHSRLNEMYESGSNNSSCIIS